MTFLADNTMNLRQSVIEEIREQQQPLLEFAGKAEEFDDRVTTVEMETAEVVTVSDRLSTQRFDTRAFPSVQDAIDTAHAAGGGEVFIGDAIPSGLDIVLKDGVYLTGRGIGATVLDVRTITGSGSLEALPALSGNIARHSRTVTFAAAPDLVPGDVFVLHDSADSSFSTARTYYRAGEFCRVASVDGATVTLTGPTYEAYTIGGTVTARKVVPIRTGISGMTIRGTTGQYLIRVDLGTELVFRDLSLSGSDIANLALSRCYNVTIGDVTAFDAQPETLPNGLNYGVSLMNCQRVRLRGVDLETRRHGLTLSGDNATAGVPNRDITVSDSRISGLSTVLGVCGCNMHGNSEDVHFDTVSMPSGFNPAGDHVTVRNCDIASAPWGGAISAMELLGTNLTFENNTIRATSNFPSNRGLCYILLDTPLTRSTGRMRFKGNYVDLGPYTGDGAATYGLYIRVNAESVPDDQWIEIDGNTFRTTAPITANHYGARVHNAVTTGGFSYVKAFDNTGMLVRVLGLSSVFRYRGAEAGAPDFVAAAGSSYTRTDGGDGSTLYVNVSGTSTWKAVA